MDVITSWDLQVLIWMQEHLRTPWLTFLMKGASMLSNAGWFFIAVTVLLIVRPKTRRVGAVCACSLIVCAIACNVILKPLIARIRPYDLYGALEALGHEADYSFPSGHTNAAFAVSLILVRAFRQGRARWFAWGMTALSAVIAFSRMYLGVHYPTDVIAGFVLPAALSSLVWYVLVTREGLARAERRFVNRRGAAAGSEEKRGAEAEEAQEPKE